MDGNEIEKNENRFRKEAEKMSTEELEQKIAWFEKKADEGEVKKTGIRARSTEFFSSEISSFIKNLTKEERHYWIAIYEEKARRDKEKREKS